MAEISRKEALILLVIGVLGLMYLAPATFEEWTGISLGEKDNIDTTDTGDWQLWQGNEEEETTTVPVEPPVTRACLKHTYTLGASGKPLRVYVNDMLNPKSGVPGVEMEVLNAPDLPYTKEKIIAIASNPMRSVVDEDTSTDSSGAADMESNTILVYMDYIFSLRGNNEVYDKAKVMKVPCVPPEREGYTFPEKFYAYYVGNFSDINGSYGTTYDCSDSSVMNITGKSGIQYVELDITIGQKHAGRALKEPVLILRSPENYELEPGDITEIFVIRKTGTDFGIPGVNLADYLYAETPIELKGSIYDEDYGSYLMSVADSATYTVKISYDADQIQPGSDKIQIALDDLGDYRAKDDVTKSTKAAAKTLTLAWCT